MAVKVRPLDFDLKCFLLITNWYSFLISNPLTDLTESLIIIELFVWSANVSALFRILCATLT